MKNELAAEMAALNRLHELSTRLVATTELQPLLQEVLSAPIELQNADFGNIQLYNPEDQVLEIAAHRGFRQEFLELFSRLENSKAAWDRALYNRKPVIIEDVQREPDFLPHRQIAALAGFRAVQSTPRFNHRGEPLGMISTHFREPHCPSERELRLTDLYARNAEKMIESKRGVTRGKRAEEALRRSEEHFRLLVEGVEEYAIVALDAEGRVSSWNAGAERITGYYAEEILGQHVSRLYTPEDLERSEPEVVLRTAAAKDQLEDQGWRLRKDGSRFWANVVVTALRDQQGKLVGFAKITRDLSERKRTEEAAEASRAELAHVVRMTTVGEMTASIAHEINQPLSAIVTNANACQRILAGNAPDLNEVRQAVSDIAEAGTRAAEVIPRIRALLKKAVPDRIPIAINELIQEVSALVSRELEKHQIIISFRRHD